MKIISTKLSHESINRASHINTETMNVLRNSKNYRILAKNQSKRPCSLVNTLSTIDDRLISFEKAKDGIKRNILKQAIKNEEIKVKKKFIDSLEKANSM